MEQHPVPQQISSYQFRLVGDMTLKQFFELAGGIALALLAYGSGLPGLFKWPLAIFFVIFGAALAFLPIEERPLEVWLIAFLRSIYQPTQFYWKKAEVKPVYFMQAQVSTKTTPNDTGPAASETPEPSFTNRLEDQEKSFFSKITGLLNNPRATVPQSTNQTPAPTNTATVVNETTSPIKPEMTTPQQIPQTPSNSVITPAQNTPKQQPQVAVPLVTESIQQAEKKAAETENQEEKRPLTVPQMPAIRVEKKQPPVEIQSSVQTSVNQNQPAQPTQAQQVFQTAPTQPVEASSAQFSPEAMPPAPPTQPNIVVGQVTDAAGKIVDSAILEIQDTAGRPVRALKTNKAGHFLIVTPLANGSYDLIVEKEGLDFETLKFEANGSVIPPMLIKAKNTLSQQ